MFIRKLCRVGGICSSGSWRQSFETTWNFVTRDRRTPLTARDRNDLWRDRGGESRKCPSRCVNGQLCTRTMLPKTLSTYAISKIKKKFFLAASEMKLRVSSFPVSSFIVIFRNASAFRPSQIQQRSRDSLDFSRGSCLDRIVYRQRLWPVN